MPKRKLNDKDYDELFKKLKKIENKLHRDKEFKRRRLRVLSTSSSSSSSCQSSARQSESEDCILSSPVPAVDEQKRTSPSPPPAAEQTAPPPAPPVTAALPSAADSPAPAQLAAPEPTETHDGTAVELDADILEILGVDPSKIEKFGKKIQKDIAIRFEHTVTNGLTKEERKEITDKYLIPENCKLINAPTLNLEIKAAVSETVVKRDKAIESKQKLLAAALSSLGEAITLILSSKEKNKELLRLLIDTGRTIGDCQYNDTLARRNFMIFSVKKEMKEPLQNTKVDNLLFGKDLSETLKSAKAINRSGADLKSTPTPKPSTSKKTTPATGSKNWKNSNYSNRKPPAPSKTKEPPTSSATRTQRPNYSGRSQTQRANTRR